MIAEQNSIRERQRSDKNSRASQQEKYNIVDAQIKALVLEQKNARSRLGYKNEEEVDAKIERLTKEVDSGKMKLVDEKKALAEASNLRKLRKAFAGLNEMQARIEQKKAENAELKKSFDNPEARALSQKYEDNQKELDEIKAAREDTNKNYDAIKAEREKLYEDQQAAYSKQREIQNAYHQQRRAYKAYEDAMYQQRRDKQKAEREAYEKDKRKKIAAQKLEEASAPAYVDEIFTAEGLIRHFDPSSAASITRTEPGQFAASAQRTVEESGPKGMRVMKKDEEDFFVGGGGKKRGKGKKGVAAGGAAPDGGKFNLNVGVIEQLSKVGVEPPMSQSDVPGVVEKFKEKLDSWKTDQEMQTKAVRFYMEAVDQDTLY